MSEHCKWCNFPCEEDEIFCSECVKENPKLAKLNEFFLEQEKRINELESEIEMDSKKRRIMVNGYNRKCERVKELEADIQLIEKKTDLQADRIKELEATISILETTQKAI